MLQTLFVTWFSFQLSAPTVCVTLGGSRSALGARCCEEAVVDERPPAVVSWREDSPPEKVVPDVSLTRSRDASTGTATFRFRQPSVMSLHDVWDNGLITGLWLRDEEGTLVTRDLAVEFERGRPREMTAILVLKSNDEWERFMRFMHRFAKANSLEFESAGDSQERANSLARVEAR